MCAYIYFCICHTTYTYIIELLTSNTHSKMLSGILNLLFNCLFSNVVFQTVCRALNNRNGIPNHCAKNAHYLIIETVIW